MISRFDHAVIAVRDLNEAIERYRTLGFEVHSGGWHTGRGTHNALIRFGLDYIELLSVYDEDEAKANAATNALPDFLGKHEGGLIGYALATTAIQQEAERFRHSHLAAVGPFAMQRQRPDGHLLTWSLLVPYGTAWCQPWPFFIQWDTPDEQRLSWEKPGIHRNDVTGCKGIAIAVRNLERMVDLYQHQLGLEFVCRDEVPALASLRATFHVGSFQIDLLAPDNEGPVQHMLDTVGEMPFELRVAVRDLEQTYAFFVQQNLSVQLDPADASRIVLTPEQALGTRLVFTV